MVFARNTIAIHKYLLFQLHVFVVLIIVVN